MRNDEPSVASRRTTGRPPRPYYRVDGHYTGSAPYFYDVERLGLVHSVRDHWRLIRDEYERNVRAGTDQVVDVFNPAGPKVPGWRSVNFQTYSWRYPRARAAFPETVRLLDAVPGLVSAYINVLEPHSRVPPHEGDSDAIIRCHLGLDVPDGDCGLRVGPETQRCRNGTLLAFCDAHEHTAWNETNERRTVLVFDVMRPEYQSRQTWICANVLSATGVVFLEARASVLRRGDAAELGKSGKTLPFPQPVRTALRRILGVPFYCWLLLQHHGGGRPPAAR
jgi:ornithine lipid ester-linked acyl 2-hydroxylase